MKKNHIFVLIVLFLFSVIFFYKFFFKGLIPIPSDIITGVYQPWLSYNWGRSSGVPVKNPLPSDIVSIIYQWRIFAIQSIKSGTFPHWTPYYFLGVPLFANFQNSLINLTNIFLFLPINQNLAWGLMVWFQIPLSLYFAFLFLNQQRFNKIASVCGALVYTFSLFSIVWLEYGIHVYVASFLPLMLYFLGKYKQNQQQKYLIFFAISLAVQIYGGYPQFSIYSIIFCFLYFIFFIAKHRKDYFSFVLYVLVGLGLAAPVLIPGLNNVNSSIRNIDNTALLSNNGFLPINKLITSISPNFWGNPATYDHEGQGSYDNNAFFPGSLAIISFVFLLIYPTKKGNLKTKTFILINIIGSFILAIQNPISLFLKQYLPIIVPKTGIATRIWIVSNLGFAFTIATFVNYILDKPIKKIVFTSLGIVIAYTVLILLLSHKQIINTPVSTKNTIYSIIFLFIGSTAVVFSHKKYFKYALPLVVFIELFYYGNKYLSFSPDKYIFPSTPEIEFLQKNSQHYRISTWDTIPQNMWMPYGLSSADGYDTLMPLLNHQFLNLVSGSKDSTTASRARTYKNIDSPLFKLLSVKYFLTQNNTQFDEDKWRDRFNTVFQNKTLSIVGDSQVLPRIRLMSNIKVVKDQSRLVDQMFQHQDPNLLFITQDEQNFNLSDIEQCQDNQEYAIFIKDEPGNLKIKTSSTCPRLLLLSDAYHPNWQVKVNNKKDKVIKSNLALRSVYLPKGEHLVELYYLDKHLYCGLIVFSTSIIFIITKIKKWQTF